MLTKRVLCEDCKGCGKGVVENTDCLRCEGTGWMEVGANIPRSIPRFIESETPKLTLGEYTEKHVDPVTAALLAGSFAGPGTNPILDDMSWENETGGVKYDADKPRMDLLDGYALDQLAQVLTFGAAKYAEHNWRKGIKLSRLLAAALRHLLAILRGEDLDTETNLPHAAHLMCCAMFLIWTMKYRPDMDDRFKSLE